MKPSRTPKKPQPRPRGDFTFGWAERHPTLSAWREPLAQWAIQHTSRSGALAFGNGWLDHLLRHPGIDRNPVSMCRVDRPQAKLPLLQWLRFKDGSDSSRLSISCAARGFFAWFLNERLSAPDDHGRFVRSGDYVNPIGTVRRTAKASETHRKAMPTRFLRELLNVLTENDWAWARAQPEDHVQVIDSGSGKWRQGWCPVRASVLALKLLLPLRTFQVRFLESSEGDDVVYRDGQWMANPAFVAKGRRTVRRRGFLHRIEDPADGSDRLGFFVNTNKTADAVERANESGYIIPWENREAIAVVSRLEAWQTAHNPVRKPMPWNRLHDQSIVRTAPRDGSAFFLMRDPCGTYKNEPVTEGRITGLWHRLVVELERRLALRGEIAGDGKSICLTRRDALDRQFSRYDLHTLRVSIITALAVDGGLPMPILSKVVGHASIVMTLYYVKVSREAMNEHLNAAAARIQAVEQDRFVQHLASEGRDDSSLVTTDPAAIAAVDDGNAASWLTLDTGMCPVGATRCHEGGKRLAKGIYGPVPGGPRNCVQCRFHITGPAFLGGLVHKFNAKSMNRDSAERELEAARVALRRAEDDRVQTEIAGGAFDGRSVERARDRVDRAETREAAVNQTLGAVAMLVKRCLDVMKASPTGLSLVGVGTQTDMQVSITSTSDIDLADRVCEAADLYPCPEMAEASLRRSQAIDRLAMRQGRRPVMLELSEQDALQAGNEMRRLMDQQVGRKRALEILTSERFIEDIDGLLDRCLPKAKPTVRALPENTALELEHKP